MDEAAILFVLGEYAHNVVYVIDICTAQFSKVTGDNIKRRMGIVLNGRLVSAPMINATIAGGKAIITGDFPEKEAYRTEDTFTGK